VLFGNNVVWIEVRFVVLTPCDDFLVSERGVFGEVKAVVFLAKSFAGVIRSPNWELPLESEGKSTLSELYVRITKSIYDKKHQEQQDQIQTLEIEMSEHNKADYDYQTTVATVLSVARRAKSIFENSSEVAGKRAFLSMILQNPVINEKKLVFTIASPFNLVLELADRPNWLRTWDDVRIAITNPTL